LRITVIGAGHLGATHAAGMAEIGHDVIGVDIDPLKVDTLGEVRGWFHEPELDELLARNLATGRLRFTTDLALTLAQMHHRDLVGLGVGVHRPAEPLPDLVHHRLRRDRIAQMPGQKHHDLPTDLQVRDIAVEIDPVRALHIESYLPGKEIINRDRPLRHQTPPTSTKMPCSTLNQPERHHEQRPPTSTVRGGASLDIDCGTAPRHYRGWVFTPPDDLPESALRDVLDICWSLGVATLGYRAVGFGSHHWEVTDSTGARHFVTVDDLRTRRHVSDESLTVGYHRQRAALSAAQALRAAGRGFVVAPLPSSDGQPLVALGGCFAVAVYPFVTGESFNWDNYTLRHRRTILALIAAVHSAPPKVRDRALPDDYTFPLRGILVAALRGGDSGDPGQGPYAQPAADLLTAHTSQVQDAVARYDDLVLSARADPPGLVLTHGEPHPGNTMRTEEGWLLIDWDTAMKAPPERDLWHIDPGNGSLYAAYTTATGIDLKPDLLSLYRLRWELTEIAACMARFRAPHSNSADNDEAWKNLHESISNIVR
jgi:hypothetical protein